MLIDKYIIIIPNIEFKHSIRLIIKLTKSNYFLDNKGRKIIINNCIFVIDNQEKTNKSVGICSKVKKNLNDLVYHLMI
jgi:hypothetical protein